MSTRLRWHWWPWVACLVIPAVALALGILYG